MWTPKLSPRTCIGDAYPKFVKTFVCMNVVYGLISLFCSVKWGRGVLLYIKIGNESTRDAVEYYAVAIGILCFMIGVLSSLLIHATNRTKLVHMSAQMCVWATWVGFALYYTSTIVERTAAGTVHILLSVFMLIAAVYTRGELLATIRRQAIDEEGLPFTSGGG
jgi:hypothetical protein